jgi:hypothetical protein
VAVDLDALDYSVPDEGDSDEVDQPRPLLAAKAARWDRESRQFLPAQLLYIDLLGTDLAEKK